MFNLFPSFQKPDWLTATGYTIEGIYYSPAELMNEFVKLRDQLRSIEEDGNEEHNNAIKLRQENAQLKVEIDNWKVCSVKWRELYDEKADTVDELVKEVIGLRHLKKENVELMERVNEIDSDQNEKYRAEIFTLKNDIALLKAKNNTLQEFIDTKIKVDWKSARIDILERDLQKCAEQRDEYKHQLDAANKEIELLKRWKKEQLTVQSWWDKVDSYVRDHDDAPLGGFVANTCLNFLKERDELKAEVEKLKEDIVDYVIEKDDEVNELKKTQDWNKIVHGVETEGVIDWMADEGIPNDEEEQKHPMYPIHWGGWDKIEITTSSTDEWQCPYGKCKEKREGRSETTLEERINKLEKKVEELTIVNICQKRS